MKTVKFKTKLVINIIKSVFIALGVIALLSLAMIAGSVSRPFAVFFNENILLFSAVFAVVFIISFFVSFVFLLRGDISRIDEIRKTIILISEGNYSVSLKTGISDEIGLTGQAVNSLAEVLAQAKKNKAALEDRKKELIANISHDLRTPLTSILGYMELIARHKYSGKSELKSYAEVAYSKGSEMKLLIDDLFEYSKLDNHDISMNIQSLNINEFLSQVLVSFVPEFTKVGISYKFTHQEETNYVNIDPVYYRRVFENILSNSISYGKPGSRVEIRTEKKEGCVNIHIDNDKTDMPPDICAHIFERNYRAGGKDGSSGLGLAIVKQIIDMHGDEITAKVKDNKMIFEVFVLD